MGVFNEKLIKRKERVFKIERMKGVAMEFKSKEILNTQKILSLFKFDALILKTF